MASSFVKTRLNVLINQYENVIKKIKEDKARYVANYDANTYNYDINQEIIELFVEELKKLKITV